MRAKAPDFIAFCLNPEMAAEATLQPMRRFPLRCGHRLRRHPADPPRAGPGGLVRGRRGAPAGRPAAIEAPCATWSTGAGEALSEIGETLSRVRAELEPERALIGFAGAPWTVATYMLDGEARTIGKGERAQARTYAYAEPEKLDALLDVLVEATARYLVMQADAGAQVLKIFESWAEGLPEDLFERLVLKPHQKLVAPVCAAGRRPCPSSASRAARRPWSRAMPRDVRSRPWRWTPPVRWPSAAGSRPSSPSRARWTPCCCAPAGRRWTAASTS